MRIVLNLPGPEISGPDIPALDIPDPAIEGRTTGAAGGPRDLVRALAAAAGERIDIRLAVPTGTHGDVGDALPPHAVSRFPLPRLPSDAAHAAWREAMGRVRDEIVRLHLAALEPHAVVLIADARERTGHVPPAPCPEGALSCAIGIVPPPPEDGAGDRLMLTVFDGEHAATTPLERDRDAAARRALAIIGASVRAGRATGAFDDLGVPDDAGALDDPGAPDDVVMRRRPPAHTVLHAIDAIGGHVARGTAQRADHAPAPDPVRDPVLNPVLDPILDPVLDAVIAAGRVGGEIGPPRLLVDVSQTARSGLSTGIQRLVRKLVAALGAAGEPRADGRECVPVTLSGPLSGGRLVKASGAGRDAARGERIVYRTGDVLLMLDSSWARYDEFVPHFAAVRAVGGAVHTVVYDLTPLLMPDAVAEGLHGPFDAWLRRAALESDGLACISRTVATEVTGYLRAHAIPHRDGLRVGYWKLGSDNLPLAPRPAPDAPSRDRADAGTGAGAPTFVMIGTIEPRKRHAVALDAMERLWAAGSNARLLVLGRAGWNVDALVRRLREHPEVGRRLTWIDAASDEDIAQACAAATALVFPSAYEGFGFPIVEAARAGLPVVAADIPVLREVGGKGVAYFAVDDPAALARVLGDVLAGRVRPRPDLVETLSWDESAQSLLDTLYGSAWLETLRRSGE